MNKRQQLETGLEQLFLRWRDDPILFVREALQVTPTTQQKQGLTELRNLVHAKRRRWVGEPPRPGDDVYVLKRGITIRSGHGTGKDAFTSWAILWFLLFFKSHVDGSGALIPCTAPTSIQLKSVLWREIAKWAQRRNADGQPVFPFSENIEILSDSIRLIDSTGQPWPGNPYAQSRTASPSDSAEKQGETLAGFHAPYMMVVADEASGVPDPVFRPLEGALTQQVNFMLLISNPTRTSGFFYDSHFNPTVSSQFIRLHWNAEDSEIVSQDAVRAMEIKYGRESNPYRVRVLGEPPKVDAQSLIPFDWAQAAAERELTPPPDAPVVMGVDVARFGSDRSAIAVRTGGRVDAIIEAQKLDTIQISEWVLQAVQEFNPDHVCIDTAGIGGAVFDFLRHHLPNRIRSVCVGEAASDPKKFRRLREELFWRLRKRFEDKAISLPNASISGPGLSGGYEALGSLDLIHELSSMTYKYSIDGVRLECETKAEMKKRGVESPNRLDALMLTMSVNDAYYSTGSMGPNERIGPDGRPRRDRWAEKLGRAGNLIRSSRKGGWMGA